MSEENGNSDSAFVQLEGLTKSFGTQEILRGVDLELRSGETLVMIGSSGGGKSVVLKHITGLIKPDKGRVLINGRDIASLSSEELAMTRQRIGLLFQNGALFDSMTVGQNVAFPLRERNQGAPEKLIDKVIEALELVNLAQHINKMPVDLSGGMRKRVALARAMITHPELMLYDEPTAGLDPVASGVIDQLILQMQQQYNVTSVVVTHDMQSANRIADRIAFLHEGRVYFCGTPAELRNNSDPVLANFISGHSAPQA
ncbi:MAG: ABC transporter ATP-binding protein [Verrucomicrobiales bacterium]|nr:ABC transporter ATP-binding protein [Verrucomicrobiales bacterium]MED5586914.1 ABC transporter ATP-binding protein [Verrucomicrobiota bacterium]